MQVSDLKLLEINEALLMNTGSPGASAVSDLKLLEINEAFASVTWRSTELLGLDPETMENVNVNGGAIAFGHPIGVSGIRIVTTLAYELRRRGGGYGAAGICGGQGDGMVIKAD